MGIHTVCEKSLATEFCEGIEWIAPQINKIELLGEEQFNDLLEDDEFKIELVDFAETSGAYIERARNRDADLRPVNPKFVKRIKYQGYLQDPQYNARNPDSYYSINATLVLRITTPLRLNIVGLDGQSMIEGGDDLDDMEEEVHFMQVESEMDKFHLNFGSVVKMFKTMLRMSRPENTEPLQWKVTDFDYHLKGNPHI